MRIVNASIINGSIINGSAPGPDTGTYRPGDEFTVQLNYTVTGTQYAVSLFETLPAGWVVLDSYPKGSLYNAGTNTYRWNLTSPLSGVSNGTIYYIILISDSATGTNTISGSASWTDKLANIATGSPTGTATSPDSSIVIDPLARNGPAFKVSEPIVFADDGDADGHLEAGEYGAFFINYLDMDNVTMTPLALLNGNPVPIWPYWANPNGKSNICYTRVAPDPGWNNLTVTMYDILGDSTTYTQFYYAPPYNYTGWVKEEWNGMEATAAWVEPTSSLTDGGWTILDGGNPVDLPSMKTTYTGVQNLNNSMPVSLSGFPITGFAGLTGMRSAWNATPSPGFTVPFDTYPIYSEFSGNPVSGTFYGSTAMANQKFHVKLINVSKLTVGMDVSDKSSVFNALKQMKASDLQNTTMSDADLIADANGDIAFSDANLPGLGDLPEGYYAILVMDYNAPNTPCLVSVAPIVVAKCDMTADAFDPASPAVGDEILFELKQLGTPTPDAQYRYIVAMIPEGNYSMELAITSTDGTVNNTTYNLKAFTLDELITVLSDGTYSSSKITIHGKNGTWNLAPDDLLDASLLQNIFQSEANVSNMSVTVTDPTTSTNPIVTLYTKPTQPTGNYVVLSAAINTQTGSIAAFNQTTIDLITPVKKMFTMDLVSGWNLVSTPLVLDPENSTPDVFFAPISGDIEIVWQYNATNTIQPWEYYIPSLPGFSTLKKIDEKSGYYVYMTNNAQLNVYGYNQSNDRIPIYTGWNLIGYPSLTGSTPSGTFNGLNYEVAWGYDRYTQSNPWHYYIPSILFGDLTIEPGNGYYIYANANGEMVIG